MKNEIIVFVPVRSASTRLPNKALLQINNIPMLILLIERISVIKDLKVVVCTTTEKSDDTLTKYLESKSIEVFRGNNEDILNRLYNAALRFDVDKFIVVEGDDLFCDVELIEKTWSILSSTDYEFVSWKELPIGSSPLGIKTNKLKILVEKKKSTNTETGWGKFILNSDLFNSLITQHSNKQLQRPDIRLTIDYPEDYELAKKLYEKLPEKFSLIDIIQLLDENPQWIKINETVKEKYMLNFKEKMISEQISDNT